ncbi:MAG: hypothetical protein LW686_05115 [Ilumatobacteraceae bacterium]|nr:hypothetical protein [Ilumatobacteraceae bacterium]
MLKTIRFCSSRAFAAFVLSIALLALPTPIGSPDKASAAGEPVLQGTRLSNIDYKTITLDYNERLHPTNYPTTSLFEVKVDGVVVPIVSVSTGLTNVEVLLASVLTAGQRLTISYLATTPVTGTSNTAVQDTAGNDAAAFTDEPVNNSSNISSLPTPVAPSIVPGPESITASIAAPTSGGQPARYRVYASPGNGRCDITGASGSCVISNLTAGAEYRFSVIAFDNVGGATPIGAASSAVTVLAKTVAPVTNISTDTTVPPVTTDSNAPSWDVDPATESETDEFTEGFWPTAIPGNIIITNEVGFTVDKKNGIKPKIRMKNYAGKIKMTISAKYKDGAKTKNYKCTYAPFGSTKKMKTAKWKWYTPKKACILPKALVTAIQTGTATLNAKGKWTRTWVTSGKKARPDKTKIKPRTLKYTVRAKPAAVK